MTQEEMIELQKRSGLPECWNPDYHSVMIEGLNFRALLKGRIEIAAAYSEKRKLCISTENGELWIEDQILIVNDGHRAYKESHR